MKLPLFVSVLAFVACLGSEVRGSTGLGYESYIPASAPRTWRQADELGRFRDFCLTGEGAATFLRIREDFDRDWLKADIPSEPPMYGDADPRTRTSDQVDAWRFAQDVTNQIATVAEAATLIWEVTGEERYRDLAIEWLLAHLDWDPRGISDIYYNDEAHFRLWRKLPAVYDHLRDHISMEDRARLIEAWTDRGRRSFAWIQASGIAEVRPNSIEVRPSSHPVRFMAMTGIAGLALWDDIPEARNWFKFAYDWYQDAFTPWGGDDGGWAEGVAYWRGVYEHATFQDALLAIGMPGAYGSSFWQQTGYFQVYFTQPHLTTSFGDLSNAGKFNMEPGVRHFIRHLAKVLNDRYLLAWSLLYNDPRQGPEAKGLKVLNRIYPTSTEYLIRDYIASRKTDPPVGNLSDLKGTRLFPDIGWVAFHSALGQPERDIHLSFKSSPYGSFSHSHADQNAFILNAFGENLAINSGYREYHRSLHHQLYTRQTYSKNALLVDLRGQDVQNADATGAITRFVEGSGFVMATGDATPAYQLLQPSKALEVVQRDVVFVDERYFVIRDTIKAKEHVTLSWLLHAEEPMQMNEAEQTVLISKNKVGLAVSLLSPEGSFVFRQQLGFTVPPDAKYRDERELAKRQYFSKPAVDQAHFAADLLQNTRSATLYAVLWPDPSEARARELRAQLDGPDAVFVERPDGRRQRIQFTSSAVEISEASNHND